MRGERQDMPEIAVRTSAARLIVCERTGRWAVALRAELAGAGVRVWETRLLDDCWNEMAKSPALPGNLMLEVLKTGAATSAAETVVKWLAQDRSRAIKMKIGANEIEASGLSHAEQMQLIDWFQTQTGVQLTR